MTIQHLRSHRRVISVLEQSVRDVRPPNAIELKQIEIVHRHNPDWVSITPRVIMPNYRNLKRTFPRMLGGLYVPHTICVDLTDLRI